MARQSKPTDFSAKVPDVGDFTFARRTMRDEIAIQVEYARIIDGVEHPTEWLTLVGGWLSVLRVLTVNAPRDWDLEGLDPTDGKTYEKLSKVYDALLEKEHSFRRKPELASEAGGEGENRVDRV